MIIFEKYQATGNDFIIYDNTLKEIGDFSMLASSICDRHYGVGADGLLVLEDSKIADVKMLYYNSDGSAAALCGNGIRCLAKYIYDHQIIKSEIHNIETLVGVIKVELIFNDNELQEIKVNLGKPKFLLKDNLDQIKLTDIVVIGQTLRGQTLNGQTLNGQTLNGQTLNGQTLKGQTFQGTVLNMGVMHTVILIDNFNEKDVLLYGPLIEDYFSEKSNVNFVEVLNKNTIKVITWEKGAGLTKACGTGAAACTILCYQLNKIILPAKVIMPGGEVRVALEKEDVYLFGSAKKICEGSYFNEKGME